LFREAGGSGRGRVIRKESPQNRRTSLAKGNHDAREERKIVWFLKRALPGR